jgi:ferrous iron transport protein B
MAAGALAKACLITADDGKPRLTDQIDRVVCHRIGGPIILVGVLFLLYQLAIVYGYELTNYTWPLLAGMKNFVAGILPQAGFIQDPLLRELGLWFMDSVNALLNYIPIFFILFALVAIMEDCGYMPRIAFILDRVFRRYGLHGQSTLPMVLGGIYVGGCAVPGVMACKAIPDEKARLATILTVPLMNCLAKVPLYILIINTYFVEHKSLAMFFIATVTLFMALPIAKVLTMTVLKKKESAPFIMEMPPYHLPTVSAVLRRATERVWLFVQKIVTVVAAVAVVVFVLMQFPGVPSESMQVYEARAEKAQAAFLNATSKTRFADELSSKEDILALFSFQADYKAARLGVTDKEKAAAIDVEYKETSPSFFTILKPKRDKEAKGVSRALKKMDRERKAIRLEMRQERINESFLGILGRSLEPITQFAGFNWRINAGLLSAFAAKESAVATLGAIYQQQAGEAEGGDTAKLEEAMRKTEVGFTSLHALALLLFMALYPPCMATMMMVKVQAGDTKWMLFAIAYPMVVGLAVASMVFTGGSALGLSGLQAMGLFYGLAVLITLVLGFIELKPARDTATGEPAVCCD